MASGRLPAVRHLRTRTLVPVRSARRGPQECSWWARRRSDFLGLDGFDPRFEAPGGGLVNHDFRNGAVSLTDVSPTVLLGEGVFHQFLAGIATNAEPGQRPNKAFHAEYERIHGRRYEPVRQPPVQYDGTIREMRYTDASGLNVV